MSMTISQLLNPRVLVALAKRHTSLALIGPPGIGKSSIVRQFPAILSEATGFKWGYGEQLAPSLDQPDMRGMCIPTKDANGMPVARYTYPAILPSREYLAEHPYGVLFIDEYNQADHLVQKAGASLLLEGIIGDYKLPKGWWVVTASNRMADKSGVVRPLMHVINRQCTVEIRPDANALIEWMHANEVHPLAPAFVKQMPHVVFTETMPSEPNPFCTPRSFVSAMRYIEAMVGSSLVVPVDDTTQNLIQGDIGQGAAASFYGWLKVVNELPSIEEIEHDPMHAKMPPSDRLDAAYVATQMVIHHANQNNTDKLWLYCERLPKELQVMTAAALMKKKSGVLLNSAAFGKWIATNKVLITSSLMD